MAETMASYKVVGVLFVLGLAGCVLIGTKAHDPLKVLKKNLKDENISCEKKVEMLKGFKDEKAIIYRTSSVDITVGQLVRHCRLSVNECELSRFTQHREISGIDSYRELKKIAEYCTSSLKKFCRDHIDEVGSRIVNVMGKEAEKLMMSVLNSYKSLERKEDSAIQRKVNSLKAINRALSPAMGGQLQKSVKLLEKACLYTGYMNKVFNLIAEEGGKRLEAKGSPLVANRYEAGQIAEIFVKLKDNNLDEDFSKHKDASLLFHSARKTLYPELS